VQGTAFEGAKIWNSEIGRFWRTGAFASLNGFGGNLHYVITPLPQLSVLFVTVHIDAVSV